MHRTTLAFVLAASLLATSPNLFDPLWSLLASFASQSATDAGCEFDPWGPMRDRPATGCRRSSESVEI